MEKITIEDWVIESAKKNGIEIKKEYNELLELAHMLPENYYFNELVLWVGAARIELRNFDTNSYAKAIVLMLVKLKNPD